MGARRQGRSWHRRGLALALVVLTGSLSATPGLGQDDSESHGDDDVVVATTNWESLVRLPIEKRRDAEPRVAMSLGEGALSGPKAGARIEGAAKLQFDVCLSRSSEAGRHCVGNVYGYDPHIRAYLLLASSDSAKRPGKGEVIGRARSIRCRQNKRASNHHCVIALPWAGTRLGASGEPCKRGSCRVNVVVSAWHPKAGPDEYVVFGGVNTDGRPTANKSTLSTGRSALGRPLRFGRPSTDKRENVLRLSLAKPGKPVRGQAIYSVRVPQSRRFDSIVVEGSFKSSIAGLGPAVRTRSQLILARSPRATRQASIRGLKNKILTDSTNFNCTQRASAHRTPCEMYEGSAVDVNGTTPGRFYINLVAGHGALADADVGQKARVLDGYLKVWRYEP